MRKELKFIFLLFLLSIFSSEMHAAKRYWVGITSNSWKNTANWSSTTGGSGGFTIPGSNDTAIFDGGSATYHWCVLDSLVNVKRLAMAGDTLSQGAYTITMGSSGGNMIGGVFYGGSASITSGGAFTIAGSTFTSTSGTFSIAGNFTFSSGSFSHNNGKMKFTASNTITPGAANYYQVEFAPVAIATYTIASGTTLTVNNTLTFSGNYAIDLNTGTISAKGDISITNSAFGGSGGTATIIINGTATQTLTGTTTNGWGKLPNVTINKSSDTLKLANFISVGGTWTYTAGIINADSSTVHFANTLTITGSHTLYNISFTAASARTYTISSGTTLTATGTVRITGTANIIINTGTIHAKGNITCSNTATGGGGTATIVINGDTNQTLTGSGTAGQGHFPKITIDKDPDDTLTLASVITADGDWIYTKGGVVHGNSTVVLYGTGNLDGQESGSSAMMSFYSLAIATGTRTLTGNLDVNNSLSIGNGSTLSAGSNSIYVGGQWNNTGGTWTYGTSTVTFDGSTYKQIKRTSGGVPATETFYNLSFNRSGGSQTLANIVTVNNVLTLTKGHVKTDTAKYLLLIDGATLSGGSDSAYVHGPVRKTGDDAFIFPLGDTTLGDTAYHPLGMTAPSSVTDQFEASYFALNQTYGDSLVDSLASISQCEYWTLGRNSGTSTPIVSVGWNKNSCNVDDYDGLRLASWNGVKWLDLGVASVSVLDNQGTVTASLALGYSVNPAPIVKGKKANSQPYAILKKKPDAGYFQVANGKLMFRFNEEYNDPDAKLSFLIYDDNYQLVGSTANVVPGYEPIVYYGSNYYLLNVLNCNLLPTGGLSNGYYMLEIINDKNEHWYLRFKHTTTIAVICNGNPGGE